MYNVDIRLTIDSIFLTMLECDLLLFSLNRKDIQSIKRSENWSTFLFYEWNRYEVSVYTLDWTRRKRRTNHLCLVSQTSVEVHLYRIEFSLMHSIVMFLVILCLSLSFSLNDEKEDIYRRFSNSLLLRQV